MLLTGTMVLSATAPVLAETADNNAKAETEAAADEAAPADEKAVPATEGAAAEDADPVRSLLGSIFGDETGSEISNAVSGLLGDESGNLSNALGGAINSLTSEDSKLSEIVNGVLGSINLEESPIADILYGIAGEKAASYLHGLIDGLFAGDGLLSGLLSSFVGDDGSLDFSNLGKMIEEVGQVYDQDALAIAVKDAILKANEDNYAPSEVSIPYYIDCATYTPETDENLVNILGDFWQENYDVEDGNLKFASGGEFVGVMTLEKQEDGTYVCKEIRLAAEGEDQAADLEAFCKEMGISTDDYFASVSLKDLVSLFEISEYIKDHPEYEKIEYLGELKSYDELATSYETALKDLLTVVFSEMSEEDLAALEQKVDETASTVAGVAKGAKKVADTVKETVDNAAGEAKAAVDAAAEETKEAVDAAVDAVDAAVEEANDAA